MAAVLAAMLLPATGASSGASLRTLCTRSAKTLPISPMLSPNFFTSPPATGMYRSPICGLASAVRLRYCCSAKPWFFFPASVFRCRA